MFRKEFQLQLYIWYNDTIYNINFNFNYTWASSFIQPVISSACNVQENQLLGGTSV